MSKSKKFCVATLLVACASVALAQNTNSADIRGTTTDQTGAILPGVNVTVVDVTKGVTTTYVTNGAGLYDTGPIVPDNYTVTFTKDGFETLVRGPVTLQVETYTIDGKLSVGATSQQVTVTTDVPLLQTESAAQTNTLPTQAIADLPLTTTNWQDFIILLPGANGTPQGGNSASNPDANASVNGNMPYNAQLNDGASILLFYSFNSGGSMKESLAEVDVQESTFSAQYGMGGTVFNQITKGGTSQYHGELYEYFKNNDLNAAPYEFGAGKPVPILKYNWFGGTIGGPIPFGPLKRKVFFFLNMEHIIQHSASSGIITVPTAAMLNGDFTGQPTIYDPTTQAYNPLTGQVTRQSFASEYGNGNKIPAGMLNPVAKAIQAYFPTPAPGLGSVNNGESINNYYYNVVGPSHYDDFFGRLDYDITSHNRLTMSEVEINSASVSFGVNSCPLDCYNAAGQNDNSQVTDVWTIRPDMLNEARISFTDQFDYDVPQSQGQNFPTKIGLQYAAGNIFPNIAINGACCMGGNINGQIGSGDIVPGPDAVYREFTYDPSDVLTIIRGRHVLKFGGEVFMMQCNCTTWNNLNAGSFNFSGVYTAGGIGSDPATGKPWTTETGVPYADFLLGNSNSWQASYTPPFHARLKTPQAFAEDTMKLRPNLTIDAGLRWQGTTGIEDTNGDMYSFDPTVTNPATGTPGAMWYASTHANGRNSLQASVWSTFLPRVGFNYQLRPNTVVRGGFGLFAYGWSHDSNGGGDGSAYSSSGSLSDATNGATPVVNLSDSGHTVYPGQSLSVKAAYIPPTTNPAAFNGQSQTYNPYHTPISTIEQWSLEVQREIGSNMVATIAYVGSHGYNLQFGTDINAVPESKLGASDSVDRPYSNFQNLAGYTYNAVSNYNALQGTINKRMSNGLAFGFNYTWSHFLSSQDSAGWGTRGGLSTYQNAYVPAANYGNSNFDIAGQLKGDVIYTLPFGYGQRFFNNNQFTDYAIGGWHLSAIIIAEGGNPFTPLMSVNSSYEQASGASQFPNLVGNANSGGHSISHWFNTAAYASPGAGVFGNVQRNSLRGPGLYETNMSLGKSFHIWRESTMEFRADATNVFNHPSWAQPDSGIGPGHNGTISSTTVGGRTMQLLGKVVF